MSVRQMGVVFELEIAASWKLVLLAMADHARDDGTGCYPSVETLARKTSQSRRGVQKIMRQLEDAGLIRPSKVSRGGPRRSTEYTLTLANSEPRSLFPATQPRTTVPETANHSAPNSEPQCLKQRTGFARTIKNHQEPSVNLARLSPRSSSLPVENGSVKTLSALAREKSVTPVGKSQKELDARRRLLLDQLGEVQSDSKPLFRENHEPRIVWNQRVRYAQIGTLADRATELLKAEPRKPLGDLAEELKQWAAHHDFRYFDACAGAATPIQQAITVAIERRKTA